MIIDDDDRRSQPRVGFKIPAHILVGPNQVKHKGYVLNLSEGGAFVMMPTGVRLAPELRLQFTVPPDTSCQAIGTIVHSMEMGAFDGLGVEMTEANSSYVHFVRNLLQASPGDILFYVRDMKRIIIYADPA